jgi:hypothetical protein
MPTCVLHGPMACRRCWSSDAESQQIGAFKLVHDPGHWGATDPSTLVLGISKGNTQSSAYKNGPFDEVAFKGIRRRILEIFHSVGLSIGETPKQFESRFSATEKDFAFASVVRCSLTGIDPRKGIHTADSPNVLPAFQPHSAGYDFVSNCVDQHLANLAPRTSLVLLLGNTGKYISALRDVVAQKRGAVTGINEVAYWSAGVKFVHLAHPSKGNGHFGAFVRGEGTPGAKREMAKAALAASI